jgi:hypothetical protein
MEYFSVFEGKHCPSSQLQMDKTERDVQASLLHCNLGTHSYNFAVENSFFLTSFLCLVYPTPVTKRRTYALLGKKFSISKRSVE